MYPRLLRRPRRYPEQPVRLAELPPLLRDEPALTRALGDPSARLAISEIARPIAIAALASLSRRRPLVVATPTGTMAGQLADDLAQFVDAEQTMSPCCRRGRRCRSSGSARRSRRWAGASRCCGACATRALPARDRRQHPGAAATARARRRSTTEPIVVRHGDVVDPDELVRRLVDFGYRREELVEHRGEFARRGAIIDVFPSTGDAPVRIDLWGDEVDRLTTFGVNDQRSTGDLAEAMVFPARELLPSEELRQRARRLVAREPWGREQWERLAEGALLRGHGELAAVARRRPRADAAHRRAAATPPRSCSSSRGAAATVPSTCSPRRTTSPPPWRRRGIATADLPFPRLHAEPDRLLAGGRVVLGDRLGAGVAGHAGRGVVGVGPGRRRRRRRSPPARPAAGRRLPGRRRRRRRRLGGPAARAAPRPRPRPARRRRRGRPRRAGRTHRRRTAAPRRHPAGREAGGRRRERPHRPAPGPPPPARRGGATASACSRTSSRACTSSTSTTASGATRGWSSARSAASSATTCCSPTRATTSSTCRPTRSTRCASTSAARRRRCTASAARDFAKAKSRVRSAVREIAQELVVLYQKRVTTPGLRVRRRHAVAGARWRTPSPTSRRPTSARRSSPSRTTWSGPTRWTAWCAATSASARPRWRSAPRSRRSRTASRSAVLVPTTLLATQHGQTFADRFAGYPIRVEVLSRFLTPGQARKVVDGLASGEVDCVIGTHRLLVGRRPVQGPRPARRRRGAALRRAAQGGDEAAARPTSTCSRSRPRRSRARWR